MARSFVSPFKWGRLDMLKKDLVKLPGFRRASVRDLICTGTKMNVQWIFTEKLAAYLREYASLELRDYLLDADVHQVRFTLVTNAKGPFLFHLPRPANSALLDGQPLSVAMGSMMLELRELAQGKHCLSVKMQ